MVGYSIVTKRVGAEGGAQACRVWLLHPPSLPKDGVPRPLDGVRELALGVLVIAMGPPGPHTVSHSVTQLT